MAGNHSPPSRMTPASTPSEQITQSSVTALNRAKDGGALEGLRSTRARTSTRSIRRGSVMTDSLESLKDIPGAVEVRAAQLKVERARQCGLLIEGGLENSWGERRGSNPRPPGPQPGALTN